MTKSDLVQRLAERTQKSKRDAEEAIDSMLTILTEALANGENIDLRGFGSFQVSQKGERQGRNPRTGEAITIAARKALVFKASKDLAERVNSGAGAAASALDDGLEAEPSSGSAKLHGDKIS